MVGKVTVGKFTVGNFTVGKVTGVQYGTVVQYGTGVYKVIRRRRLRKVRLW